jgi:hypothetical protein
MSTNLSPIEVTLYLGDRFLADRARQDLQVGSLRHLSLSVARLDRWLMRHVPFAEWPEGLAIYREGNHGAP